MIDFLDRGQTSGFFQTSTLKLIINSYDILVEVRRFTGWNWMWRKSKLNGVWTEGCLVVWPLMNLSCRGLFVVFFFFFVRAQAYNFQSENIWFQMMSNIILRDCYGAYSELCGLLFPAEVAKTERDHRISYEKFSRKPLKSSSTYPSPFFLPSYQAYQRWHFLRLDSIGLKKGSFRKIYLFWDRRSRHEHHKLGNPI